ncbi:MAG: ECF-type sigma factor [bacterium]|nr:ECF-type sigma factor [bacterium]
MAGPRPITELLDAVARGDREAPELLLERVYGELHQLADRLLRREDPGSSLQATILVHDAWLSLAGPDANAEFERRAHFFGAAARAMRRVLVDHARSRKAQRRAGHLLRVTLDDAHGAADRPIENLAVLQLHEALEKLEETAPEVAQVVELRYFAGLTVEETARALGRSAPTVKRSWAFARAWLHDRLKSSDVRRPGEPGE